MYFYCRANASDITTQLQIHDIHALSSIYFSLYCSWPNLPAVCFSRTSCSPHFLRQHDIFVGQACLLHFASQHAATRGRAQPSIWRRKFCGYTGARRAPVARRKLFRGTGTRAHRKHPAFISITWRRTRTRTDRENAAFIFFAWRNSGVCWNLLHKKSNQKIRKCHVLRMLGADLVFSKGVEDSLFRTIPYSIFGTILNSCIYSPKSRDIRDGRMHSRKQPEDKRLPFAVDRDLPFDKGCRLFLRYKIENISNIFFALKIKFINNLVQSSCLSLTYTRADQIHGKATSQILRDFFCVLARAPKF